ncbi:MAG TPA: chemotaxis protein CheB [Verrucomicrobiae bacterium]|nr:chemotaxis protein CheB [Verrucomicrobiae bacterium]
MKWQGRKKTHDAGAAGKEASEPQPTNHPAAAAKNNFPIVGVGASAGGLEAFTSLLQHLPADTGMAFVLVQHLDPDHPSALTELLTRITSLPVCEVTDRLRVQPNHVYVIPPNAAMIMEQGTLRLQRRQVKRGALRAIDHFFESLALDQRECAVGIVLSGTASDGTFGLEAIKAEGGITFAQDASAKYDSMPRSAVAAGCVDLVLSPELMAQELARIARHPSLQKGLSAAGPSAATAAREDSVEALPASAEEQNDLKKVLLHLRSHSGVDFSLYKPSTIHRRIARRMVLNKAETLDAYAHALRRDAAELDALYRDILISVTSFFRNPEAFEVLQRKVFPKLLEQSPDESVRFWVLGCSTGQEPYSLAMAYTEFAERMLGAPKLQIFASDLNEQLLEKARQGLYPESLVHDVSPERRRRFFTEEPGGGFRINKALRDAVIFARHNVLTDPPFSRLDLISCRNLLIYLNKDLHGRILSAFHYGLKPGGCLFLGVSESASESRDLFEPVDKKLRIFVRKPGPSPTWQVPVARRSTPRQQEAGAVPGVALPAGITAELNAQREADRLLVSQFAPASVLINAESQILQFRGATGPFLEPAIGKATHDLLKMACEGLKAPLRALLEQAKAQDNPFRKQGIRLRHDGQLRTVNLEVIPLKNLKERCYLVLFHEAVASGSTQARARREPAPPVLAAPGEIGEPALRRRIAQLERELAETRDYLQSIQEQYEAANEQLQFVNEEATSGNEELQSINEELETSKEELESSNEELTTVNEELGGRNAELNRLIAELHNFHISINTPILVLGRDLTVRRFTPPVTKIFNLLAGDVGRALSGVRYNLDLPELEELLAEVVATGRPLQREVRDKAGHSYDLRARPFLTLDNRIDGVVLMLLDIEALKKAEHEVRESRDYAQAVVESVSPLLILKPGLQVLTANASFYRAFQVTPEQTLGRLVYELGNGQWNIPKLRSLLEEILPCDRVFRDYEVTREFDSIGRRTMLLSGRRVQQLDLILLAIEDITARKEAEEIARRSKEAMTRYASDLEGFSYSLAHDMRAPLRAMRSFASLIEQAEGERLSPESRDFLERIGTSAVRLDELIRDALSYAKAVREELPLQPVDVCQLLRGMVQAYPNLQPSEADVIIDCDGAARVLGNHAGLVQCFSNLLGNAVKFVPRGAKPWVRVWTEDYGDQLRVWVEDRGIGIPEDSHEKIFGMFQRLHRTEEFPGTGVGLALVRKVIQRMGGQVGLESTPGQGSKFWVELPKATPA